MNDISWRYEESTRPPGQWRQYGAQFAVAGIHYRRANAERFIDKSIEAEKEGLDHGVEIVREPSNRYDRNALMVMGFWEKQRFLLGNKTIRLHIGYVPRELAAFVATLPKDMPLAADLNYAKNDDGYIDIYISLLFPGLKSGYWQGRDHPFG